MSVSRESVLEILDRIKDPCSQGTGCPLGLVEMGLIGEVKVSEDALEVWLRLTQPGCLYAALLQQEIEDRLKGPAGQRALFVRVDDGRTWTEDFIVPAARARLQATVAARHRKLKVIEANFKV